MLNFESDYIEGAHPKVLEALVKTNMEPLSGYGADSYTKSAEKKILERFCVSEGHVQFITGGTQTNQLVIDSMLKPFEGVIAATSGHVSVHEAGAIEYTGHKVLQIPSHAGKIEASELDQYVKDFYNDGNHEHMVFPGLVYITFPTEYGTIYSRDEMQKIHDVCKAHKLPLYVDGARLGYGLMCGECSIKPEEFASLCDVFYIGGTKVGALCGEAVVFPGNTMPEHFVNLTKKHGALLAKGRLSGVQFDALFTDDLYFKIAENAVNQADKIRKALKEKGYRFFLDSPTNQIFIVLENEQYRELSKTVLLNFWEKVDESHTAVRLATSWATTDEKTEELIKAL